MSVIERRRPGVLRALRVLLALAFLVTFAVWLGDFLSPSTTAERTFTMTPVSSRLTIETTTGAVRLTSTHEHAVRVHRKAIHGWREPVIEERLDGSAATLRGTCPAVFARGCTVDYDIAVPDGFTVDVRSGSGELDIRGIRVQHLRTDVSSARTSLVDVAGPMELRSSSGSVTAMRLNSADVKAEVSSGSTSLDFATAPSAVTVSASSGNVTLRLPVDGPYRVRAETSSGTKQIGVPDHCTSPRAVTVTANSGNIAVLPL
jgi:Putative adhesin